MAWFQGLEMKGVQMNREVVELKYSIPMTWEGGRI
jgi:hypothetical protein